jgi:hypothetical protein
MSDESCNKRFLVPGQGLSLVGTNGQPRPDPYKSLAKVRCDANNKLSMRAFVSILMIAAWLSPGPPGTVRPVESPEGCGCCVAGMTCDCGCQGGDPANEATTLSVCVCDDQPAPLPETAHPTIQTARSLPPHICAEAVSSIAMSAGATRPISDHHPPPALPQIRTVVLLT